MNHHLLFLCLIPTVMSGGVLKQRYTSSERLSISLKLPKIHPGTGLSRPINVTLAANVPKTAVYRMERFEPNFQYGLMMKSPMSGEVLASPAVTKLKLRKDDEITITYTTSTGITLTVETVYSCEPGFFGPSCDRTCTPTLARERCDSEGHLRCEIGWRGPQCSQSVDPRHCGCKNQGVCVSSLRFDDRQSLTASEELVCECLHGFSGEKCEISGISGSLPINGTANNPCDKENVCLNGAECFANGPKPYCSCRFGYTGEFCQIKFSTDLQTADNDSQATTAQLSITTIILCISILTLTLILCAACFTYKLKPYREQALARCQLPPAFPPQNPPKNLELISKGFETKKDVYTIENGVYDYQRYTEAPKKECGNDEYTYATISRQQPPPPPPTLLPPPTPILP